MLFLNTYEIDDAVRRFAGDPVLGPASQTLANLRGAADENSDGWAYWPKPARAARALQQLLSDARWNREYDWREDYKAPTSDDVQRAYRPIKAFQTRSKIAFDIVEPVAR